MSVFECIGYRLSGTSGAAPAEKADRGLDKGHGLAGGILKWTPEIGPNVKV